MDSSGTNDSNPPDPGGWKGKVRRDDTPSFIRDVQARAEMLNPTRGAESIPVLKMPSSVRIWRRIRWPLLIGIIVAILAAVGLFTNDLLVARSVEREIAEARVSEELGTLESLLEAKQILSTLAERQPKRPNAQIAWAWHAVLLAELFGPPQDYLQSIERALKLGESWDSGAAWAARAGARYLADDHVGALELAARGLKDFPNEPRLQLVRAWALAGAGKRADAEEVLENLRLAAPQYVPALHVALDWSLETGDRALIRQRAEELLAISPGNLFASLASVAVRLPSWGEREPSTERLKALVGDISALTPLIQKAPRRLALLGRLLRGKVSLFSGQLDTAIGELEFAANQLGDSETLAWYAVAVQRKSGPAAALKVIDAQPDKKGPEISAIRVKCLLEDYKVEQALKAFEALANSDADARLVDGVKWELAVRRGDLEAAREALPKQVGATQIWIALEQYEQLRAVGDREGIDALTARMTGDVKTCADAIQAWHGGRPSAALEQLQPEDGKTAPCVAALAGSLLRGHLAPAKVLAEIDRAIKAAGGNLSLKIDRALALWLAEGQASAGAALDEVRGLRAEGQPFQLKLGQAYLTIGLAQAALEVVEGSEHPEALAIQIAALEMLDRQPDAERAIAEATKRARQESHPALLYWVMRADLDRSDFDKVLKRADAILPTAGHWSAEIGELKARALNTTGNRGEADRELGAIAKEAQGKVGLDEGWQATMALIRLNLRRGGNFLLKAIGITSGLYKAGVKDAELSYSYAVANIRQGNERGAVRYLREALDLDPGFLPAYSQLSIMGKLSEEQVARLERTRPGAQP